MKRQGIIFLMAMFIFIAKDTKTIAESGPGPSLKPKIEYKAGNLRDPFESPFKKGKKEELKKQEPEVQIPAAPLPTLVVQGIFWGGNLPQAIINNKVVKIGDTIEGARIIDINKDGVTISFNNRQYNLSPPAAGNLEELKKKPKGGSI